jgi:gamma-glutamyltranspeptidase/glutathione hydrolase
VAQAAREVLARANAIDAVVAGLWMAVAEAPGVLLGPVQILAGGGGAGLVAVDGRVRQPGRGAPRPRGFLPDEPVPEAAYAGVPALPSAVAAALASLGTASPLRSAGPALSAARTRAPERASVLEAVVRRGAPALAEDAIAGELVAVAGRAARGLLTPEDLAAVRPEVLRTDEKSLGPAGILRAPWRSKDGDPPATHTHVVAAIDGRGLAAIACYEAPIDGVRVPALGLLFPRAAAPVLRGTPRAAPGDARPAAAPIALRSQRGLVDLAIGIAAAPDADALLATMVAALDEVPTFAEALKSASGGRNVAISATRDQSRVLASA